jgi:Protein of unknown function (DUF1553)/Protein of unknown function (DUF1549)
MSRRVQNIAFLLPAALAVCVAIGVDRGDILAADGDPPSYGRHEFEDYERDHWAFMPVARPKLPEVADAAWIHTPVDPFVLARLEHEGVRPAQDAGRLTLLRRVYFDLIGLPPTPAEQRAFLADESPDAYAQVVDDLLARPQYGERWGRHWLDVVRYAESNGYERDGAKPHVWRYRDYTIASLNADKPYDRFILEQLAGDELAGSNAETQTATTFLRLGLWDDEPADPVVDRYDQLDDVLDATYTAFQGITLRCARCHDHKFEPFRQTDYARAVAIFEPLKRPQDGRADLDRMVGTTIYRATMAQVDEQVGQLRRQMDEMHGMLRERVFAERAADWAENLVAAFRTAADKRNEEQKKLVGEHEKRLTEAIAAVAAEEERSQLAAWTSQVEQCETARPASPPRAYVWFEEGTTAPATHVFSRGNPQTPLAEVGPGLPAVLVDSAPPAPTPTTNSTGRRLQLAQWIASPHNPLTARVMVNRLWQHHFGVGIVSTVNDFGLMGEAPTHPELLDWLAAELVESGWRLKHLHRLMVLSHTYQLAAEHNDQAEKADPGATLLWRWRPRRLEAEAIRDAMLATSGQLNIEAGGPSVFPEIAAEVLAGQSIPGNGWKPSPPDQATRRSVYVFVKRTLMVPELEVMDFPNTNQSCGERPVSTVAPQALSFLNGDFAAAQSRHFATRVAAEGGAEPQGRIELAYRLAFGRPPSDVELAVVAEFLAQQEAQIVADAAAAAQPSDNSRQRALEALCLVLLNANEFAYIE